DRWTARTAAFFLALAPYPIRYSQSLRVYSQAIVCAALLVATFLELIDEDAPGWRRTALLALITFAALLSVYGSVWLVLMMAMALVRRGFREPGKASWRAAIGLMAGGALAAPWYLLSLPVQLAEGTPSSFYDDKFLPRALLPGVVFLMRGTRDL